MEMRSLPQEFFEGLLDKRLTPDEEYALFTLASPEQLKEFFKHQRLNSTYEELLPQLFDESDEGLEAVREYFDRYELEYRSLMNVMRSHNTVAIGYYIARHPLTKEALDYLESGIIPDYEDLLAVYQERQKKLLSNCSCDDFIQFIRENKLSSYQIKSLIDENNLSFWYLFLNDLLGNQAIDDENPLLSDDILTYLLQNGSDDAIIIYFEFGKLSPLMVKKLIDSRKKFLILAYCYEHQSDDDLINLLLSTGDIGLMLLSGCLPYCYSEKLKDLIPEFIEQGIS